MIDVRDLTFGYGETPVLTDVDLHVDADETFALMGPNGAGKTTLLKCIAELYEPDDGRVEIAAETVGFAPERPDDALFAASVEEEVAFFARNRDLDVGTRVAAAMEEMNVAHLSDRVPQTLSAGEKRRVSLAAVLSGDPAVVALDEPTSGLDARHVAALGATVQSLDRTVVLATHDADFALRYADRVALLDRGTVLRTGPVDALLADHDVDYASIGIRPPGAIRFARRHGWDDPPLTVTEAAARRDAEESGE
ncbi:energy-coupling factor ABC transporter ATP-binding protein [Halanaeroarchaeum sulfurireducens]|uniref:ABC-type cobalt transport system, ATP-binding protein n=1 Tax=Halanaeroarchaeum sulfurireducens TaxID=1604004 RepID=A0A0F7P7Y0_9EURY|nr:ABC transporter ATP-binding protein [Halanaeroarchaeum sulfurireducens]AKH96822.1 ABC-type cobalt transport system, ATP-binding protein [Halanaeroarchaeum sulfurireducens]ALG81224.1 ABC-type cobalt transport system, ATP-binding protein [Halanaeroarchaeum sulfurireducens]